METINYLNAVLGYNNPIPNAPVTRSHRLDMNEPWSMQRYKPKFKCEPRKERVIRKEGELTDGQKRILKIVMGGGEHTGVSISKKTSWTTNHCSMTLCALFKFGKISRKKVTVKQTRSYVYYRKQ